jgi:hypothetical protein
VDEPPPLAWWRLLTCDPCHDGNHDDCWWLMACVCAEPPCTDRLEDP